MIRESNFTPIIGDEIFDEIKQIACDMVKSLF